MTANKLKIYLKQRMAILQDRIDQFEILKNQEPDPFKYQAGITIYTQVLEELKAIDDICIERGIY